MAGMTPLTYQILLALADGNRHGYGIIKEIETRAGTGAAPSTGALYLALQRMEAEQLIEETDQRPPDADDARRRYYRISESGRTQAETESVRLLALVDAAREKKLIVGGAS
jgi:DNA-binding PadR family transcriptional regulator